MMKAAILVLVLLTLGLMPVAAADSAQPEKFAFYIGGFFGPSYNDVLQNDGLHVQRQDGPKISKKFVVHPTPAAWKKFMDSVEKFQVSRWAPNYLNKPKIFDGTQWELNVTIGKQVIKTQGDNYYPRDGDVSKPTKDCQSSKVFDQFCAAVEELAGQPKPQ